MNQNNTGNDRPSAHPEDPMLIANGPMAISERARVQARYGKDAIPGGTEMVDFNARVTYNDSGHLTINAPSGDVGGNPKDVLFRLILKKDGDEIAAKVGNTLLESRGDILSGRSINSNGSFDAGGFTIGVDSGVTLTPSVRRELMENVQLNFDIQMAQKVIQWCKDNPDGAAMQIGNKVIAYDRQMVADLRQNATDRLQDLVFPGQRRSSEQGETVGASSQFVPGNDNVNRQFAQALQGTNGDRDAAAAAIETLRNTPGYKADRDVAVVQGLNGQLIATQGQGDAALNVAVAKVNPGDFERVANQIAQAPQQTQTVAVQPDQPERSRTM